MSRFTFLTVALALTAAACGSDTPTTPTTPAAPTVTSTFSGELNKNGGDTFSFATAQSGTMTATLSALGPDSALIVGLALGTWNGNACQIILPKDNATQGSQVIGQGSSAGNYCVRIYDVGNVVDPITYEIQVVHF
jgi:hypothetical protein